MNSLQSALSASKEEILLLRHQLLSIERTLSEEIGLRDAQISRLGATLDQKARLIAHFTKQLHQMKIEFTRLSEASSLMQSLTNPTTAADCSGQQKTIPEQQGRIRRRVRRATASALPHNPDPQNSPKLREKTPTRRSLPTPNTHTPSPPPPRSLTPYPPSTSPPLRLLHRANRASCRSAQHAAEKTTHQNPQRPRTNLHHLDPVQLQKQAPPDVLRHEGNTSTPNICAIAKSSPPILPPIPTSTDLVAHYRNSEPPKTQQQCAAYSIHPTEHSHVILARSQQLNSASSNVRMLTSRGAGETRREGRRKKQASRQGERGAAEGGTVLLVKEDTHHQKNQAWQELHQSGSD